MRVTGDLLSQLKAGRFAMPLMRSVGRLVAVCGALALCPSASAVSATVTVRVHPERPDRNDEVHFVAASGERNRVEVRFERDDDDEFTRNFAWTIADSGNVLTPGESCASVDQHTVKCTPRGSPGDTAGVARKWLSSARLELGDLDDEVIPPSGPSETTWPGTRLIA